MKLCNKCWKKIEDEVEYCPYCGEKNDMAANSNSGQNSGTGIDENNEDEPSMGMAIVGFLFPLFGFIIYLCLKSEKPKKASSAANGAVFGLIIGIVVAIFSNLNY